MLNKEKYAKELEEILVIGGILAFDKKRNEVCTCQNISCSICGFYTGADCADSRKEWLNSEYVEPVDWSKVPVDTPILVRDSEKEEWKKRHLACIDDGKVCTWCDGATSWSARDKDDLCKWSHAKLAEETGVNG